MARATTKTGTFNRDMLDDGVLRPRAPADMAEPGLAEPGDARADYERRLAALRAEIQLGLDDEAAGLGKEYDNWEDLFNDIMSDDDDEEAAAGSPTR